MNSRALRRIGVIINYLALLLIVVIFYLYEIDVWVEDNFIWLLVCCFVIGLISNHYVHMRTGLYKLTHTKFEKLDEREIQLTHNALRTSYIIFTILILISALFLQIKINILNDFQGLRMISQIIFAVLLALAHTLPASIIAWKEKEV